MKIDSYEILKNTVMTKQNWPVSLEDMAKKLNRPVEQFSRRADGRIEWHCEHGIGHTVWYPKGSNGIHGCDGCCRKLREEAKR